jgi:hypothetical protein
MITTIKSGKGPFIPLSLEQPKKGKSWKNAFVGMVIMCMAVALLFPATMSKISIIIHKYISGDDECGNTGSKWNTMLSHVRMNRVEGHLKSLYNIAKRTSNSRSILNGYNASAMYIAGVLREHTDYDIELQPFQIDIFSDLKPPALEVNGKTYDVATVQHSGSGSIVSGNIVLISPGCSSSDYRSVKPNTILLLFKEGPCDYKNMLQLAADSGASAIMLYSNLPGSGPISASLRRPVSIPVIGISHYAALDILEQMVLNHDLVFANLSTLTSFTTTTTLNVIATTKSGNDSSVILAGSHLDSVPEGPGINDDGSGASGTLEVAVAFYKSGLSKKTNQKVKFAFWSGEE